MFGAEFAVFLPGTGSDAEFAEAAFAPSFARRGMVTEAVQPDPSGLVAGYTAALDEAARSHGPIVVGGISIGAAVAARWALSNPSNTAALVLALPAWTGDPDRSVAAISARFTAQALRADGLDAVTEAMVASSPKWLATTLRRSWAAQWPALPDALDEAASFRGPSLADLAQLEVPTAVVGASDDPVHPLAVARSWVRSLARGALRTVTLADIGDATSTIGDAAIDAMVSLERDTDQDPGDTGQRPPPSC